MKDFSDQEEFIASQIVDSAIKVHQVLGPGLLEKVYEACFCRELEKRNLEYKRQLEVPIIYDGIIFNEGMRLDVLVSDTIICAKYPKGIAILDQRSGKIKAVSNSHPVWNAQLLSYMKLSNKRLGFILNFGTPLMKDEIKRMAL